MYVHVYIYVTYVSPNISNDTKTVLFTAFAVNWPAVKHLAKKQT